MKSTYVIEITGQTVEDYYLEYFEKYPRRKVKHIKSPIPPSLNRYGVMTRKKANCLKQAWTEFGVWLVEKLGLENKQIKHCTMDITYVFPTKRKCDLDNLSPKYLNDAFVKSGFLLEDNYTVINPLILHGLYKKGEQKVIIKITETGGILGDL